MAALLAALRRSTLAGSPAEWSARLEIWESGVQILPDAPVALVFLKQSPAVAKNNLGFTPATSRVQGWRPFGQLATGFEIVKCSGLTVFVFETDG
jgi:hypothetical protein